MIPSFSFLGRTFTIYPLMALAGIFVAGIYACRAAKRAGQNEDDMIMLLLISSFGVFLGMHLLYGLVGIPQWSAQMDQIHGLASFFQAMVAMWGGSVFYGGLLGGLLAGACYLRQTSRSLGLWSSPGSSSHSPLSYIRPDWMLPGRMLLRASLRLGGCLPIQSGC